MGCREAKRRLNKTGEIDGELRKHLDKCPECSREVAAWRLIETTMENARNDHEEPATPFAEIRAKITADTEREKGKENSIMSKVQKQIVSHRRFSIALVVAAAVFVFVVLVPFSYDRTIGYNLAYTGLDSKYDLPPEMLTEVLTTLGYRQVRVELTQNGSYLDYSITGLPSSTAAKEASVAFTSLTGYSGEPVITLAVTKTSASLYAQVRDKLIKIEVESEGKSEAEIKAEIEDKLREQGLANPDVTVTLKPDGMREIKIGVQESTEAGMKEKQIKIMVPEDEPIKVKCPSVEISVDSKDKTDAEIKEEIRQKLAAEGMKDADISVTTDSSGERNIEIKMGKEDCDP
jgi:hypothetical protein